MTTIADDARRALDAKSMAERDLARLTTCPPWRHAAFAALMAALVAAPAVPLPVRFAVLAGALVMVALIVRSDRRRLGVFVNGYRRGRTRLVALPLLAVVLAIYGVSLYASLVLLRPTISLALAVVAFGVSYLGSVIWQRVFARELGA